MEGSSNYLAADINVIDLGSKSFQEVILELKKRPLMWLPENNIEYLHTFLLGWLSGSGSEIAWDDWHAFNHFVESKFGVTSTIGWAKIISSKTSNSEEAVKLFYDLVECFSG